MLDKRPLECYIGGMIRYRYVFCGGINNYLQHGTRMKTPILVTLEAALMYATFNDAELEKLVATVLEKLDSDLVEVGFETGEETNEAVGEVDNRLNEIEADEDDDEDEDSVVEDDEDDEDE